MWPRFDSSRAIGEAFRVARDLYDLGHTAEGLYIFREAAALADPNAVRPALQWWSDYARRRISKEHHRFGTSLHRLAQRLIEAGYGREAVRVLTLAFHFMPRPTRELAEEAERVLLRSRLAASGSEPLALVDDMHRGAVHWLSRGVVEALVLLGAARRIAPERPWPVEAVQEALRSLPERPSSRVPAPLLQHLARTAYALGWLGHHEPAASLGLLVPHLAVERPMERLIEPVDWFARMEAPLDESVTRLSVALIEKGYRAESAEIESVAISIAGRHQKPRQSFWALLEHDILPGISGVRPTFVGQATTRGRAILGGLRRQPRLLMTGLRNAPFGPLELEPGALAWPSPRVCVEGPPLELETPPPAVPAPSPGVLVEAGPPAQPRFYFALEGEGTDGGQVRCGAEVNLVFNYAVPPDDVLAHVTGKALDEIRKTSGSIDLTVIPHGFSLPEQAFTKPAVFKKHRLWKPVRFRLKASLEPQEDAGVLVLFRVKGTLIYERYLETPIVAVIAPGVTRPRRQPLDFDLDDVMAAKGRERDYTADIARIGPGFWVHTRRSRSAPTLNPSMLDRAALQALLNTVQPLLQKIAEHKVFETAADPLWVEINAETERHLDQCVDLLLTAGWRLYAALREDPALGAMLEEINNLPPGLRVSIWTDSCFLPWTILYPVEFNHEWPETSKAPRREPQKVWGYRFDIESLITDRETPKRRARCIYRDRFITLCLNPDIDGEVAADDPMKPVETHRTFFREVLTFDEKDLREGYDQTVPLFNGDASHDATFLYFYCHGDASDPFAEARNEEIELEDDRTIHPQSFVTRPDRFARQPVVFLNSCSSGAFSPLVFDNFLKAFRRNGAEGMVATSFPVPIKFAAAFGQAVIRGYLGCRPIGQVLLDLRRQLLDRKNPLGLFYSLHCALDLQVELAA